MLYLINTVEHRTVIFIIKKLCQICKLCPELGPDKLIKIGCKKRIGIVEPSPVSNTVCDVSKFLRCIFIEIVEYGFLKNIRMKL